jgi:DNA-binding SARP family transcriptional activator/tetratricopeptide (TPR) repeat protein
MIELRTLGSLDLRTPEGREVRSVLAQPRRLALLAYLAIGSAGGFARRDALLAMFWPDSDDERARGALRQAVRYLRTSLGTEALVNRAEDEIGIGSGVLRCDVLEFREALGGGDLEKALSLYQGDLLEGFAVDGAPEFDRWLEGERRALRAEAARAAWRLADAGPPGDGLPWARRGLDLAPYDEVGLRRLLVLLDRTGNRSGAIRTWEMFTERLAADLDVEPSPETRALVEEIRGRSATGTLALPGDAAPPRTPPSTGSPRLDARVTTASGPVAVRRPPRLLALAGMVTGIAIMLLGSWLVLRSPAGPEPDLDARRVLVLPFENRTGDASLDPVASMTADWIVQGLAGRGALEVVPVTAALAAAVSANPTGTRTLSAYPWSDPRPLALETGAGTAVVGAFYVQGDSLHFQARVVEAMSGHLIAAVASVGTLADTPLDGIQRMRERVLLALAPLSDDRDTHVRMARPPPSWDAYSAYVSGFESFVRSDMPGALRAWEQAAAADSTFFMPAIAVAIAHLNLGNLEATDSITRRIQRSRADLGPLELATLDMVQAWLDGDQHAAWEASLRQARIAPGSIGHYQVAEQARRLNRPSETIRVLTEMGAERGELRGWLAYWWELADAHHMLGDHQAELLVARRARELYPGRPEALRLEASARAALGQFEEVDALIAERLQDPSRESPTPGALMAGAALEFRAHGYLAQAERLFEQSIAWYGRGSAAWGPAVDHRPSLAVVLYDAGRWDDSRELFRILARESPGDAAFQGYLGALAARAGDGAEAGRIDRWLREVDNPYALGSNTFRRARIAAAQGDRAGAVELLGMAFGEGLVHGRLHHLNRDFESLRDYPPFEALMRPR